MREIFVRKNREKIVRTINPVLYRLISKPLCHKALCVLCEKRIVRKSCENRAIMFCQNAPTERREIMSIIRTMIDAIADTFRHIVCAFLPHKSKGDFIFAYSIDEKYMYAIINIYRLYVYTRCKEIVCDRIDQYERFGWTVSYLAKIEEKKLRKNGLVSLAEAYQKLEKEESQNRDF